MADNVAVTAGTGTTVAADEVVDGTLGTVKVQFVKLMDGTLDGTSKAAVGTNGLAVSIGGRAKTLTDKSGTVTSGGVAQDIAAINASRTGFWIQNQSTGDIWLSTVGTSAATQPSMLLPAGSYYEMPETGVPTTAISIFGATTGQAFSAREW